MLECLKSVNSLEWQEIKSWPQPGATAGCWWKFSALRRIAEVASPSQGSFPWVSWKLVSSLFLFLLICGTNLQHLTLNISEWCGVSLCKAFAVDSWKISSIINIPWHPEWWYPKCSHRPQLFQGMSWLSALSLWLFWSQVASAASKY